MFKKLIIMEELMKKNIYLLLLVFLLASGYVYSQGRMIPDVMNNINILDNFFGRNFTVKADSLPVYPGFPLTLSGNCFEGGIYCNMDNDPEYEIVYNTGYNVNAINLDGTQVPGWPKTVSSYALEGAPAFGDIDGDGQSEIVVTNHGLTSGGYIYAFKKDGTPLTGFPINHGYSTRTPVLADLNNDNILEIIVNLRTPSSVYVYKGDATIYPGWPKSINHVPASSAAVGDITGDGVPEIVAESYSALYVWKANGDTVSGFPFMMPNGDVNSYSSPVLVDVNGDNKREIIFGTHVLGGGGYVYILKNDGTIYPNWPKSVSYWIYGPPAVGYIDSDNILDIAIGDQIASVTPVDMVYAWNVNGSMLSGFPIGPLNAINSQIVLADLDNDNNTELIFDDNTQVQNKGKYLIYNHDGTPSSIGPIEVMGTSFFSTPCVFDINRDGNNDIAGSGSITSPYTVYIYLWNVGTPYKPDKLYVPMFQFNPRHNGVYGDIVLTGESEIPVTEIPESFSLSQNYPNPFNQFTNINYKCSSGGMVKISVYDLLGKKVAELINEYKTAGAYTVNFNANGLTSGIYFCQLYVDNVKYDMKKMVYLK
jgi:hypothetical protein